MTVPLLILGSRTRPAADSARRAGYEPIEVTLTADRRETLQRLDAAPRDIDVLLANGCETVPELVEAAAFGRKLIGSGPDAIRGARDPRGLAELPKFDGLDFAVVRTGGRHGGWFGRMLFKFRHRGRFLLKPMHSTDGRGIRAWDGGDVPLGFYLQQHIEGTPVSAVFYADGWSCVLIGVTEQLVGDAAAGAQPFQYCGSIYPFPLEESQRAAITHLAVALAQRHDLRGLFGIDFILDATSGGGTLWPIEVNPRYTDAVEVIERSDRINALQGRPSRARSAAEHATYHGKLLVRATSPLNARHCEAVAGSLPRQQIADFPGPATRLAPGDLLATVYATAATRDDCAAQLKALASKLL